MHSLEKADVTNSLSVLKKPMESTAALLLIPIGQTCEPLKMFQKQL